MKDLPKILVILGPNASGKSDLAVNLALEKNGEIVSADSRQVYKGLDIGSGKITPKEMKGVPHHLLDVVSPHKVFTASDYSHLARKVTDDILSRGKLPIICGGTGFYIDALIYGNYFAPVPPQPEIRAELEKLSTEEMAEKLAELDPDRFASIDKKNRTRLLRALEIVVSTGKPVPKLKKKARYNAEKIGILWPMEKLDKRIEIRLDKRLNPEKGKGMIDEVADLKFPENGKGLSWKRLYDLGLEYRYISLYLKGELNYKEMRQQLLTAIKQYARRQMTWFKKDKDIKWIKK
ncbi:MAG: tRNA (adenosine(37)-N6)-dimethylallyltransferase MiaA [Candidatus Colwellbacteria bacterium]|nr:tRNA (adenosine(37)-N6)-dimethylallyltransferase MiaA [Candidatus Colwellbacteria bacterium]